MEKELKHEILLELAQIINSKFNCPVNLTVEYQNRDYEIDHEDYRIYINIKENNIVCEKVKVFDRKNNFTREKEKIFDIGDPNCFKKFKKWVPGTKIKRPKPHDIDSLPSWARKYIDEIISCDNNFVICPRCGGISLSGYVCFNCKFDNSDGCVLYPIVKWNNNSIPFSGEVHGRNE